LSSHGVDPQQLVLEITEQVPLDDERAWTSLADLRGSGVRTAIDDFGTGYASLSYLRQPAIDIIKIDQSFLENIASPRDKILVQTVLRLARDLGLDQVAEGVQDDATRTALLELGCQYGQGVLFAGPMPVGQAATWSFGSENTPRRP
jgi:EAL domain-containing protein (putative c-di-GMP-specific phosphodiesterase class I)